MSGEAQTKELSQRALLLITTLQTFGFVALGCAMWVCSDRMLGDLISVSLNQMFIGLAFAAALVGVAATAFIGKPEWTDWLVRAQGKNFSFLKDRLLAMPIVWISICAGVGEEVLFRAGLQTLLGDYLSAPIAIGLSSALFAAIHLAKPAVAILLFMIGVMFGVVYDYSGSLLAVIITHSLYDVFALAYVQHRLHKIGYFEDNSDCTAN